jgi:cell wall-associated NlpC family hydrolase
MLAIAGMCLAAMILSGCSASAPRFRGTGGGGHEDENELRFATRIQDEERREDDRRVSVDEISRRLTNRGIPAGKYSNLTPAGLNRDRFLLEVIGYLGVSYVYGGNDRDGIDCSGLSCQVYKNATKTLLPRSAREQYGAGRPVAVEELQFGDLVFFNTTGRVPSHVGIYIEDDVFAHASVTRGVTFSSLESTYYKKRYVGARRIARDQAD